MSKRALKKYAGELRKPELELQLLELYEKFAEVKQYFDFVFNPREEQRVQQAMARIRNEYFPIKRKKARARRSLAQKQIRQFEKWGMDAFRLADLMLFNLETTVAYASGRNLPDAYYKSMLNSFTETIHYLIRHHLQAGYSARMLKIHQAIRDQDWPFPERFSESLDALES